MILKTKRARAWALDSRGGRAAAIPGDADPDGVRFSFGPRHKTLWYEIATE
jgi:hypothetical protein